MLTMIAPLRNPIVGVMRIIKLASSGSSFKMLLKQLGIETYLGRLAEERRLHKKEAKEAAMKKRREEKERSNSQPTSNSIAATALSSDSAEVDSNRTKDDVITIDGETILIGDIAKPGIDSDRARKRKLRAITPALPSSTQTRRPRTSAPVQKGLQYTRASFNQFIAKPWSVTTKDGKKIGGKDKRGHGLI